MSKYMYNRINDAPTAQSTQKNSRLDTYSPNTSLHVLCSDFYISLLLIPPPRLYLLLSSPPRTIPRQRVSRLALRKRNPRPEARHGHGPPEAQHARHILGGAALAPGLAASWGRQAARSGPVLEQMQSPLGAFPGLDAGDVEGREARGEAPFPRNALVLEEVGVEYGDVHDGEDGEGAQNDGPEEEAVGVEVLGDGDEG